MRFTDQNHIDAFLRNELSQEELQAFESKMANDASFKERIEFESTIQKGLSNYRKTELKGRLDGVEISPVWYVGSFASTLLKSFLGVVAVSIVGVGLYQFLTPPTLNSNGEYIAEDGINFPVERKRNLGTIEIPEIKPETASYSLGIQTTSQVSVADGTVNRVENISKEENLAKPDKSMVGLSVNEPIDNFEPLIEVPKPGEIAQEDGLETGDAQIPEASVMDNITAVNTPPVDVKTIKRRNERIQYKYFDGKLFLYGDFQDDPYELLEINGISSRSLYLFHKEEFYFIEVTDHIQDLQQVENERLVDELTILRNNKP